MHTRNPDERRPPKRYDDFDYSSSPASSSPTENSAREKSNRVPRSSSLQQQLRSPTPPKRKPRRSRNSYRGPVIPFTPILSPTTFPKDHQIHPDTAPDQERTTSLSDSDEQEETVHHPLGHPTREDSQDLPSMFSVPPNAATAGPGPRQRPTITVDNTPRHRAGANMQGQGLGPNDNGPNNPVYMRNMELMEEWGGMTEFDRLMESMKDSDEDEPEGTVAQELAQGVTEYDPPPSWDDLPSALKLDVGDTVNELCDADPETIMNKLRLNNMQKDELARLSMQRKQRQAEEDRNSKLLKEHQREILLKGGSISSEENRDMMERTIYRSTNEDNFIVATRAEVDKAKSYLRYCGFDPSNLVWLEPHTGAPALHDDQDATMAARMGESSDSEEGAGGSSPRPALLATQARAPPPHAYAESALPQDKDAQEKDKQSRIFSHRRAKVSGLTHAHSSPAVAHAVAHAVATRSVPITSTHPKAQRSGRPVPGPSPHDRGRSVLRTNNTPPGQKYNPQPQLPLPSTAPFASSVTSRLPTKLTTGAPMNNNKHATIAHGGDGQHKRKRSFDGSSEDDAGRSKARSAPTRDYHVATPAEPSTSATKKPKKSGGSHEGLLLNNEA